MTVLWLLAAQAVTGPRFIEIPGTEFSEITADAVVKLPALDNHERCMLDRIVKGITAGPPEYGQRDLMAITGGRVIRCEVMPDHVMIEIPAFKEDVAGAVAVLVGVLKDARLDDSSPLDEAVSSDPWTTVLIGPQTSPDPRSLRPGELLDFYHRIFRPESITVAVSGPFQAGAVEKVWNSKVQGWDLPKPYLPLPAAEPLPASNPKIGSVELDGPEIAPDSADIGSSMLALFALGCGKGGSLHRIAREKCGLSYRQEAVLWPSNSGWIPRLVVAAADLQNPESAGATLKSQLVADVANWTVADQRRAAGLAEGVLMRGVPLSPFYFHTDRSVGGSPWDRAFLEAYWISKTGNPWNPEALVSRMKGVSLEALKAAATELLTHSELVVRRAND